MEDQPVHVKSASSWSAGTTRCETATDAVSGSSIVVFTGLSGNPAARSAGRLPNETSPLM